MNLLNKLSLMFNIHPSEGWPVILLLVHSFSLGVTVVFFYTAASALFLVKFDVETLPYAYIISAGVITLVGFLYSRLEKHLPVRRLLTTMLAFLFISVLPPRSACALWAYGRSY